MMYLVIVIKIVVGMLGVLFFLRISGKTQMAIARKYLPGNSFSRWVSGLVLIWVSVTCSVSN